MEQPQSISKSVYFPNLNAIRFIAAFMVIIHHIEQIKDVFRIYPNKWNDPIISYVGTLGVRLFFVLSGFLITYLLFIEKEVSGRISIKKFYIRRALRIWPLYYLIVVLALFIIPVFFPFIQGPHGVTQTHRIFWALVDGSLFVFFLPNYALAWMGPVPFASHLWSIGTEEQFYFVWPVLMKYFKNKFVLLISVIIFYISVYFLMTLLPDKRIFIIIRSYWHFFPIDNMAIGGLAALVVYSKTAVYERVKKVMFNRFFQAFIFALLFYCLAVSFRIPRLELDYEFYGVLFAIIIANMAANERRLFSLETPILNYLGKISYGLYMYHPLIITICLKVFLHYHFVNNYAIYAAVILSTVLVAGLSYRFYESKFIKQKKRFSTVLSGDNTKEVKANAGSI